MDGNISIRAYGTVETIDGSPTDTETYKAITNAGKVLAQQAEMTLCRIRMNLINLQASK